MTRRSREEIIHDFFLEEAKALREELSTYLEDINKTTVTFRDRVDHFDRSVEKKVSELERELENIRNTLRNFEMRFSKWIDHRMSRWRWGGIALSFVSAVIGGAITAVISRAIY